MRALTRHLFGLLLFVAIALAGTAASAGTDEVHLALSASAAEHRRGLEIAGSIFYLGHGVAAFDAGVGAQRFTDRDRTELRPFLGVGAFESKHHRYLFLELQGAFGGPWSPALGLRLRGGWMPFKHAHLGAYACGFLGATTRGEAGFQAGVVF